MNNLQVSTAGAELAAQEADQSLAASQDLAAECSGHSNLTIFGESGGGGNPERSKP